MIFNQVDKVQQLDQSNIVKYQIVTHCFLNEIFLTNTELECLTLLGCRGKMRCNEFCTLAAEVGILGSAIAVHNCLRRIEKSKLVSRKRGGEEKKLLIFLNPELGIQTEGNIILNYKFVAVDEGNALDRVGQENGAATQLA